MATAKTVLKKTHQEAIVKIAGTTGTEIISLTADLLTTGQVLGATGSQAVNIAGVTWSGDNNGMISITRGGVGAAGATGVVMTLQANACSQLDFSGQSMIPDSIGNTSNIGVTITGAQSELWIKLRKVAGYQTTIEPEQFGPYDNPSVAGS